MQRKLWSILITALLFLAAILIPDERITLIVFLAAYALIGWDILWKAARNIIRGNVFDEHFLMSLATIGALAIAQYAEAVAVMLLYQIGEYFQDRALDNSRESIAALMDIRPETANLEKNGQVVSVAPDTVEIGDVIVVRPGERVPLDGVDTSGQFRLWTPLR